MESPSVSVVIPAYNHEASVGNAIDSVLEQTFRPIELVVVDDGSTDDTWDRICCSHAKHGGAFRIFRKSNEGVSATLNFGIRQSSGTLIAVLASDDRYVRNKIERQVRLFARSPEDVALVHSSAYQDFGGGEIISNRGTYLPVVRTGLRDIVSLRRCIVAPTVMFKRSAFERVGGFDESMVAEDVDFYAALAAHGYGFAYDPEPLVYKTVTDRSLGTQVRRWSDVHHRTLEKYRDHFTPQERVVISSEIHRSLGRTAAGTGDLSLAFRAFHRAAIEMRRPTPYAEFLGRSARHLVLKAIPRSLRHELRRIRAASKSDAGAGS